MTVLHIAIALKGNKDQNASNVNELIPIKYTCRTLV